MCIAGNISNTGWIPVIDGDSGVFPDIPSNLFAQGKSSKIPFISGDVLDEGTHFITQVVGRNYSAALIKSKLQSTPCFSRCPLIQNR
ncbi:hypothetical protein B0H10DRAFT_2016002 [Mycena sp. CBHHK59/15]|nr:hypothetical protein B0H10DRAFT_2016002 [Mycena sp. CBHHK59/15]